MSDVQYISQLSKKVEFALKLEAQLGDLCGDFPERSTAEDGYSIVDNFLYFARPVAMYRKAPSDKEKEILDKNFLLLERWCRDRGHLFGIVERPPAVTARHSSLSM